MADYYKLLGVSKSADDKEIRQAFRKLARKHHPDLNPGDKDAEKKFKEINEAYEVLSNAENRGKYDRYGDQWRNADRLKAQRGYGNGSQYGQAGGFEFNVDDLLGDLGNIFGTSGGRRRTRVESLTKNRFESPITVTLEDAFSGSKFNITIPPRGNVRERKIEVTVPAGVDSGSVVHISPDADTELYLNVTVSPHPRFERQNNDLFVDVQVPFEDAILGSEIDFQTLSGKKLRIKIPPESQNGQRIRLTAQGMPRLGSPDVKGNLYVVVRPTLPKGLTDEQKALIQQFRDLSSSDDMGQIS